MYLLDTCVLLWLATDQKKISSHAFELMQKNMGNLFVSSSSCWEIALKTKKKKLSLPLKPLTWFQETLQYYELRELSLSSETICKAIDLPDLHQDPFDRILIATALLENLTLLSPDATIQRYPHLNIAW